VNIGLRLFVLFCGVFFDIIVINLLIKKRISERNSIIWFMLSLFIFILSLFPGIIDFAAGILGIDYPPTLLFLLSILLVFFILLNHYIQLSTLNSQLKEITQQVAIINFRLKNIEEGLGNIGLNNNIEKGNDDDELDTKQQ
jgi:hypothetical protein